MGEFLDLCGDLCVCVCARMRVCVCECVCVSIKWSSMNKQDASAVCLMAGYSADRFMSNVIINLYLKYKIHFQNCIL